MLLRSHVYLPNDHLATVNPRQQQNHAVELLASRLQSLRLAGMTVSCTWSIV